MRSALRQLAQAIEHVQRRPSAAGARQGDDALPTGCAHVDSAFGGGLARSAVHEWFADVPPLTLLLHLAKQAIGEQGGQGGQAVMWIGRSCWPHPVVMGRELLERSLFVDPPDAASRLWAIDLALRCPAVAAVIGDGSGLAMPQSRRLQLAAEAGGGGAGGDGRAGGIALLARPMAEIRTLSAASTRWTVSPVPTDGDQPQWRVELLRAKTSRNVSAELAWQLES